MANRTLTADVIASEALAILKNQLGWMKRMHRAQEDEFTNRVNGYKIGDTISIRRPADFTVRSGAVMDLQDVIEGKVTLTINQQVGVDFQFTSSDLTLKVEDLSERVIRPAMNRLVNEVAKDVLAQMYVGIYNWVGTPSTNTYMNSFADFAVGPQRLDEMAVPQEDRYAILTPPDFWGMVGSNTALYVSDVAREALRRGELGMIGNIDTFMSQVLPTYTEGTWDSTTPIVKATGAQDVTYDAVKDTWTQTLLTTGWDTAATITAGSVFTIAACNMVNPVTKQDTGILQQFVVTTAVTANVTTSSDTTLTISPPIIFSGPYQTCTMTTGDLASNALVPLGTASAAYRQNIMAHKNAMALACVPMEMPQGSVGGARKSAEGISIRVIPIYDGVNDISKWRTDILYGRRLIDPRLAVRVSQS
jgi:hypothetical protein